ncbi:MAG: PilC/PilY family type IV pilus protein, partial [Deltaproteobacteria bacterium]
MKKMRSDCLTIMTVMITLIIVVWTGMAQASAEEDMFTATTQPDALILLDLSGSMGSAPSGGNRYGATSACTADTIKCAGLSGSYHYSSNAAGNADLINCVGAPDRSHYPYSANAACTADTTNCTGTVIDPYPTYPYARDAQHPNTADTSNCNYGDCSHGFCQTSHSRCSGLRGTLCSGGFCKTSTPTCAVNCNYDCSGGFCAAAKPGYCDVNIGGSCSGGFCQTDSQSDCNVDCAKLAIAKRSIYNFLDDNNDGQITIADKTSLGVRMGYMRFYNCSSSSLEGGSSPTYNYTTGCNTLIRAIDSPYSQIYCGDTTSCSSSTAGSSTASTVSGEGASGGTPISTAQVEAKLYLDAHKATDPAAACRNKFVILITDGADTLACNASGSSTNAPQRRESVAKAKALADAGYKVFVIGFGASMPEDEKNTLNWMAYYGRTDDPNVANTGNTTSYSIPEASLYPSGLASCSSSTSNDPGLSTLGGYAYIAADADALAAALRSTISIIRQANYSFSQASIQASRTNDENFLYEGSFEPADSSEPFWKGHLKKYQIGSDGAVGAVLWDAGTILQSQAATNRNILTYTGAQTAFNTTNITAAHLGVATADEATAVVGYIRGDAAYNPEFSAGSTPWKLGDVFRSTPITIGTPSTTFNDVRDCNNRFSTHSTAHPRTSANGRRMIVVGANDGQLHGFKTSDGTEAWSFIPPNLLPKLKNLTHSQHPPNQTHQYFDDGPITVADVWDGTTATGCGASCSGNGECKAADSWKTVMVFGEGRGAIDYAWSSSASCSTGLSSNYSVTTGTPAVTTTYPYYCGYHAMNLTDSLVPTYMWHLNFADAAATTSKAPYLGDPWSKMMIGRVRVKESGEVKEKWVGFIGAGYNGSDCTGAGACDTRGKGFLVVDLTNGNIIWSYTHQNNAAMDYSLPASPTIVDTDGDGFIDTAYSGDLGGNMWRFAFCRSQDGESCGIANWSGGKFFDATGNNKSIYTSAAIAKDTEGNLWVYWGTGNKIAPTAKTGIQEWFYAVKDRRAATAYTVGNLTTLAASSTDTFNPASSNAGFRIQLANPDIGEKVMADPTVFGGIVYFTTYTPSEGTDACNQSGTAKLYGINYTTAAGVMPDGAAFARYQVVGSGIPSAPVISFKPGTAADAAEAAVAAASAAGASASAAAAAG